MPVDFSVVVPTWNRCDTLAVVLPSLLELAAEGIAYEVLLCDSGSDDGTAALAQELSTRHPHLRHLVVENRGRAGARNAGIREARGEVVLFTDADIIADPSLLAEHARTHREHPGGAVVGREVQVDSLEEYQRVRADRSVERTLHPDRRRTLSWLYFLTGNASVPRAALLGAGGFDEAFTGYGHEDLELGYRLQRRGIPIRYNARAINYHWHPVGFEEKCRKMRLAGRSTVRFYNKHRDWRIRLLLGWNPFSLLWHATLAGTPALLAWVVKRAGRSRFWSEVLLQYCYLCGIEDGRHALGAPSAVGAGRP